MQGKIHKVSLKNIGFTYLFLTFMFLFFVALTIFDFQRLISKSYKVNVEQVVPIDTFFQQGKADYTRPAKGGKNGYIIKSIDGYSFHITKSAFEGIMDRYEFEDHLKYHGLQFIAYSDRETRDKYLKTSVPFALDVFQIKIGDKNYIDIKKGNSEFRERLLFRVIGELLGTILFLTLLIHDYRKRGNDVKSSDLTLPDKQLF